MTSQGHQDVTLRRAPGRVDPGQAERAASSRCCSLSKELLSGLPTEPGARREKLPVGMVGGGDVKVATVEVESVDNMATLPVSRAHGGSDVTAEKNNVTNKEMELKKVRPQPLKR